MSTKRGVMTKRPKVASDQQVQGRYGESSLMQVHFGKDTDKYLLVVLSINCYKY